MNQQHGWLLVPSPLLGPSTWMPVAEALRCMGEEAVVAKASMTTTRDENHYRPWLAEVCATPNPSPGLPVVVVAHSAACPRAFLLASELLSNGWPIAHLILVDGRFPDGVAAVDAYPQLDQTLDAILRPDDYLPPWHRWWGSLVVSLVPDSEIGKRVFDEAAPIPHSLLLEPCPAPPLPDSMGRGYLGFGNWYADSLEVAQQEGFLTVSVAGDHLHQVVEPEAVAGTLLGMVAGIRPGRGLPSPE